MVTLRALAAASGFPLRKLRYMADHTLLADGLGRGNQRELETLDGVKILAATALNHMGVPVDRIEDAFAALGGDRLGLTTPPGGGLPNILQKRESLVLAWDPHPGGGRCLVKLSGRWYELPVYDWVINYKPKAWVTVNLKYLRDLVRNIG